MNDNYLIGSLFQGEERHLEMEMLAEMIAEESPECLADIAAYIRVAQRNKTHKIEIQHNVAHDLINFGRSEFVPRTRGYAKREQEGR